MLRGVNKQIIEINSTENDFFEKAILFVRPEKADTDGEELHKKAIKFLSAVNNPPLFAVKKAGCRKRISKIKLVAVCLVLCVAITAVAVFAINKV